MAAINSIRNFSISNAYNSFGRRLGQAALDLCGGRNKRFTIESKSANKNLDWIGRNISSAENRLILGASALMSQPFIDAANKKVDDETRRISICRTVAKIIVGTATGFFIRKACIKSIDAFAILPYKIEPQMKFKKLRSCLLPTVKYTADELDQYKNALGTLAALGVMLFTNFLIDAPLTKALTNYFDGRSKQ